MFASIVVYGGLRSALELTLTLQMFVCRLQKGSMHYGVERRNERRAEMSVTACSPFNLPEARRFSVLVRWYLFLRHAKQKYFKMGPNAAAKDRNYRGNITDIVDVARVPCCR